MKTAIQLIAEERLEQIAKHGRTIQNDIKTNTAYQLSNAASLLCLPDKERPYVPLSSLLPENWDIDLFDKMYRKPYKERLIIAAALIAAEIDRLNATEQPLEDIAALYAS